MRQDLVARGKAEAAIQGRRAAWWPADSWSRLIFTLEPEVKTNLTNGKSLISRNQVMRQVGYATALPVVSLLRQVVSEAP